ncbi:MAG TPA: hypothetical protein VF169_22995 [Albitalea sp.]|uniref:hypothetical protein n=1 Tax=Piscinibacter sp. TaxID=1903157 RepID=UPI002ED369F3
MTLSFRHSGRLGDIVCALPLVKRMAEQRGEPADFFIPAEVPARLDGNVYHPGGDWMVSRGLFDFIEPLIAAQPYIRHLRFAKAAELPSDSVDLDRFRGGDLNLKAGMIQGWYRKAFGVAFALEDAWLAVQPAPGVAGDFDVLVNHTTRFCNTRINYRVLQAAGRVGFVGLPYEYEEFMKSSGLAGVEHVQMTNALDLAQRLVRARVVVGNQSLCFAIAEGLKVTRALEVFEPVPTAIPVGGRCTEYITTAPLAAFLSEVLGRDVPTQPDLPGGFVESIKAQEGWKPPLRKRVKQWWRERRAR